MGDLLYSQTLTVVVAKKPTVTGASIQEKDFEISPPETLTISDYSESSSARFSINESAIDEVVSMGSVVTGKTFIIKPESDILVKFLNSLGTTMDIKFLGGKTSIMHVEYTGVKFSNPSSSAKVKGKYLVLGD